MANPNRGNRIDQFTTRDLVLNGRRVRNAADAVKATDYTTLQQINKALDNLSNLTTKLLDELKKYLTKNLKTINKIPKIVSVGLLGESSLSDNGILVSSTEPISVDTGTTPANSQVTLSANALGTLELLSYAAGIQEILLDCSWVGSTLIAKNATTCRIVKSNDKLFIRYASGQTVGNAVTDTIAFTLDLTSGDIGLGGQTSPSYAVDTTGYINASTGYRIGGTAGITQVATLAKLTVGGTNGSLTIVGGIVTGYSNPT